MPHRFIRTFEKDGMRVQLGGMTTKEFEDYDALRRAMLERKSNEQEWLGFAMRQLYRALVWGNSIPPIVPEPDNDDQIFAHIKAEFPANSFRWLQECMFAINGLEESKTGEAPATSISATSAVA